MAAWSELTQQQRDEVQDMLRAQREWSGMMARLGNLGRALALKYNGNVETTLAALDAGEIPVYDSGQGQEPLTKAELIDLVGYAMTSSEVEQGGESPTSYNTNYHRALYVKAAGLWNTLQQGQM